MRLVVVTASFPFGPGEAFLAPEIEAIVAKGHEVALIPLLPRGKRVYLHPSPMGIDVVARTLFDRGIMRSSVRSLAADVGLVLRLHNIICRTTKWRPRVKNAIIAPKALWLAEFAKEWRADHIHSHWASTTSTLAYMASMVSGIPWSYTAHRWDIQENNLLAEKSQSAVLSRFISQDGIHLSGLEHNHELPRSVALIHMGVPLPMDSELQERIQAQRDRLCILCPGALIPRKGQGFLLDALERLRGRGWYGDVFFAGDGPLRPELERRANLLMEEGGRQITVEFLGNVDHQRLLGMYRGGEVDVVVLPSLHEGIPVSLMEAMAYGVPVISTLVGGVPELVSGVGMLVEPGDAEGLADAIQGLSEDPAKRRSIAILGLERVRDQYEVNAVVDQLLHAISGTGERLTAA